MNKSNKTKSKYDMYFDRNTTTLTATCKIMI